MPLNNPGQAIPTFHELDGTLLHTTNGASDGWEDFQCTGVPGNAVVYILVKSGPNSPGVRIKGSALNRTTGTLDRGSTWPVMLDANSKCQVLDASAALTYLCIGYWA